MIVHKKGETLGFFFFLVDGKRNVLFQLNSKKQQKSAKNKCM